MKATTWLVTLGITLIIFAFLSVVFPANKPRSTVVVLPNDYYSLQVTADGEVLCFDKKSGSILIGMVRFSEYPPNESRSDGISDMIVVTSSVGITESDLEKVTRPEPDPKKSEEENLKKLQESLRELEEKINSLKPMGLFHIHVLDKNTATISAYKSKATTWLENLMFWRHRFQKEWQLLYSETYSKDRAEEVGNLVLEKVYGMKCKINR